MYSSRVCLTIAPSGGQYGSPAPISGSVPNRPSSRPSLRWSNIVVSSQRWRRVTTCEKPRALAPGLRKGNCQRAGTLSGVVVITARFMSARVAGQPRGQHAGCRVTVAAEDWPGLSSLFASGERIRRGDRGGRGPDDKGDLLMGREPDGGRVPPVALAVKEHHDPRTGLAIAADARAIEVNRPLLEELTESEVRPSLRLDVDHAG